MSRSIPFFDLMLKGLLALLIGGATLSAQAQMAQKPLLTQSATVPPNVMLIYDDSGSMDTNFIYQHGKVDTIGYGRLGPTSTQVGASTTTPTFSPDVNRIAYDPRKQYKARLNADGTSMTAGTVTTSFNVYFYRDPTNTTTNAAWDGTNTTTWAATSAGYFGTTSTLPAYTATSALVEPGATANLTYPNTVSTTAAISFSFPKFLGRTDCTGNACTLEQERWNYARWKAYHSTRNKVAQTGLGQAFQGQGASFRLGWARMNLNLEDGNSGNGNVQAGVGLYNDARRTAFFTWLYGISPSGGTAGRTALDRVGQYFSRADDNGPWSNSPTTATTTITSGGSAVDTHVSCRRSYALYMTDGYWNDPSPPSSSADTSNSSTITGTYTVSGTLTTRSFRYTGTVADANTRLYRGTTDDTMADIAMYYWVTDLRPDLQNRVTPVPATSLSRGNPSFWQNMGTYAIGLGVYGTLPQTATTVARLSSGTIAWPAPSNNQPEAVDDMWHASINGRGQMASAKDTDELTEAIEDMFEEINRVTSTQSGVAASTISLNTGTRKYTPNYTTGAWTGNVIASNLDARSAAVTGVAWQVVGTAVVNGTTQTFTGIPPHGTRTIVVATSAGTSTPTYGEFRSTNTFVAGSITGGSNANLINYLRGDQTNETPEGARYRAREFLLGDIVNSSPAYIGGGTTTMVINGQTVTLSLSDVVQDLGYDKLPAGGGGGSYRAFLGTKATRAEGVLFVGANDGMLHGFRNSTGAEVFAFVPRAVLPNMHQLAQRTYAHRYFVDGPNVEADACLGSGTCTWKNLVIGTTGAGAKSVYALNVTTPMAMTTTSVLWEIDTSIPAFSSTLGHVLTDVQSGYTKSGQWVAVFGNGYESANGSAVLYIVNLQTGALIRSINVDTTGSNGLGGVRLVYDANKVIIGAYAGDLKGKMWRFDLSNASPSNWFALTDPLWAGPTTQPITQAPVLIPHPLGGHVVAFGTGKLYQDTDVSSTTTQAMYGVWDSVPINGTTTVTTSWALTTTDTLVRQTISGAISGTKVVTSSNLTTSTATISYYQVSRNPVTWGTAAAPVKRGWYIQWPNSGQRVIYPPTVMEGRMVAVDTMSPISDVADDPCVQSNRGKAWNYLIDALTGQGPSTPSIDTNNNGVIERTDAGYSGYGSEADGETKYMKNNTRSSGEQRIWNPINDPNDPAFATNCAMNHNCAFINRSWRQLFPR